MNLWNRSELLRMKTIPIRKGLSGLLILEAVVITTVTVIFMVALYRGYSELVYTESAEVLNLYAMVAESKLAEIEALSFEVLSNRDIQANLRRYVNSSDSFEAFQATSGLYTQLFTRWILNDGVMSISFQFLDGQRVEAGQPNTHVSEPEFSALVRAAIDLSGSAGWTANVAGLNTVTLYRLIRDSSGTNHFEALGTLIIHVDADYFLGNTPALSQRYRPQILAIAGQQALYREPLEVDLEQALGTVAGLVASAVIRIDQEPYFAAARKLSTGWDLVYLLSTRELMRSIYDLNLIFGLTLVAALAVVVAIGHVFATSIHRPIGRLTRSMKAVEEGDYKGALAEAPEASRFTEVAQLSRGFRQMVREIDRLINEVYTRQLTIMDMRYKMLRQQINPHFLYNTLDTINWRAIQGGDRDIPVIVKSLSRLLRGALKAPDLVALGDELNFVEDYLRIQKFRFEERLEVRIDIPEACRASRIPHLTLQPIVENCIVHNLERFAGTLKIEITAYADRELLRVEVADNGRGIDLDHARKVLHGEVEAGKRAIGLHNIHMRIQMSFGEVYGLDVRNRSPQGAIVAITLPFEEVSDAYRTDSG